MCATEESPGEHSWALPEPHTHGRNVCFCACCPPGGLLGKTVVASVMTVGPPAVNDTCMQGSVQRCRADSSCAGSAFAFPDTHQRSVSCCLTKDLQAGLGSTVYQASKEKRRICRQSNCCLLGSEVRRYDLSEAPGFKQQPYCPPTQQCRPKDTPTQVKVT